MPPGQRRSRPTFADYERDEFRLVSVGPQDAALWDVGDQKFLTGTSEDGSARVLLTDKRDRMQEVLDQVQGTGKPVVIPVPRLQVWSGSVLATPDRGHRARLPRIRTPRSRRAAAATTRRGTERGRGD